MSWAGIAVGVVSIGSGIIKGAQAKKAQKAALAKRTPYQTPKELLEVVNATKAMADQGLPQQTLNYLTNQNDRALNSSLGALQRLGGDANSAAALFDQNIQNTFKIGSENALLNMQNFSKFLDSEKYLASSRDAEWASQQGMIKDEQAAAQQRRLESTAQIGEGVNAGISAYSNYQLAKLYAPKTPTVDAAGNYVAAADPQLIQNPSSASLRAQGATIGGINRIVGYDINGNPIYGK